MLSRKTPLRRVPFKSKPPAWMPREERTRAPLQPIRVPRPSVPIFRPMPKHVYVDDRSYRQFVASHDCFECGIGDRSQAAHSNAESDGKGGSIKASDTALFPLCATTPGRVGCHEKHDLAKDGLTRAQRRARELEWIERMHAIARGAGWNIGSTNGGGLSR